MIPRRNGEVLESGDNSEQESGGRNQNDAAHLLSGAAVLSGAPMT